MPFQVPSLSRFRELVVALGQALFPGFAFASRRSFHGRQATFISGSVTQLHAHIDSAQRDLHPLTAGEGKPITDWIDVVGVERKEPTGARKAAAGRVRGAAGATVPLDSELQNAASGVVYRVANLSVVTIPGSPGDPDGFFDADIAAIDTGALTRLEAGQVLTFLTPPPGIEAQVVLQLPLDEDGFDREQFGSVRGRFLEQMRNRPAGGNQGDIVGWIKESLPSIRSGYAYRSRNGRGSVDLVGFYAGSGAARALSAPDREAMLDYVRNKVPIQLSGEDGDLRALVTVADPQIVRIKVTPNGQVPYRFDWSGAFEVLSWNGATRELQFAGGALPADLRAGQRLILEGVVAGSGVLAQDGRQYRIESVSGVDKVILEAPGPSNPPAAGDLIWSGGPLVDPLRASILAHLNGETVYAGRGQVPIPESASAESTPGGQSLIGLNILAAGIGPANPNGRYGPWVGGIKRGILYGICQYKQGVRETDIVTPAADYEALDDGFPNNDQIHFITPAVVVVRES